MVLLKYVEGRERVAELQIGGGWSLEGEARGSRKARIPDLPLKAQATGSIMASPVNSLQMQTLRLDLRPECSGSTLSSDSHQTLEMKMPTQDSV